MAQTKNKQEDESVGRFVLDIIIMFAILMGIYYFIFSFSFQMKLYPGLQCSLLLKTVIV